MKKMKMKKTMLASLVALGVAVPGVVAPLTTVHAADAPQLKIKKVLNLPESGVKTPTETFHFTFTPHSKNGNTTVNAGDIPTINTVDISYTDGDNKDNDTATDGKQVIKTSSDALANVTWPESGQYTYTVVEKSDTATEGMTYSKSSYTVSVFTKKTAEGTIVVDTIQIQQDKNDKGEDVANKKKTEYNPGGAGEDVKNNNFSFSNNYDKKGGNSNPDPTPTPGTGGDPDVIPDADMNGFALMRTVTGGTINTEEVFKFSLKAEKPVGSHSDENTFTYRIVKGSTVGEAQTANYGQAFEVDLRHHDRVVFDGILLGSKVSAEETFSAGYNKSLGAKTVFDGTAVSSLDDLKSGKVIGNNGKNGVYFMNAQQTPTGIVMNNLPYIVVVAIASVGVVLFAKRRRNKEEA